MYIFSLDTNFDSLEKIKIQISTKFVIENNFHWSNLIIFNTIILINYFNGSKEYLTKKCKIIEYVMMNTADGIKICDPFGNKRNKMFKFFQLYLEITLKKY